VGHHINGHSVDVILYATDAVDSKSLAEKRQQELEADEFSGFIMAKLGASLNQASGVIDNLSSNSDDSYSTHPSRDKRLNAIRTGYNKGNTNNRPIAYEAPTTLSAYDYFYRAYDKQIKGDLRGAIADYSNTIEIDPNYASAYNNRGYAKNALEDYYGAIADYSKAIEIDPNFADSYVNRGIPKNALEDYYGAIADYTKAIEIDPNFAVAYNNRGIAKYYLENLSGACSDWRKAANLGNEAAANYVRDYCN